MASRLDGGQVDAMKTLDHRRTHGTPQTAESRLRKRHKQRLHRRPQTPAEFGAAFPFDYMGWKVIRTGDVNFAATCARILANMTGDKSTYLSHGGNVFSVLRCVGEVWELA